MRLDADYSADFVFTPVGAAAEVQVAKDFVREARALLAADGWLD